MLTLPGAAEEAAPCDLAACLRSLPRHGRQTDLSVRFLTERTQKETLSGDSLMPGCIKALRRGNKAQLIKLISHMQSLIKLLYR